MKRIFLIITFVLLSTLFASDKAIELDTKAKELQEKITNLSELKQLSSEKQKEFLDIFLATERIKYAATYIETDGKNQKTLDRLYLQKWNDRVSYLLKLAMSGNDYLKTLQEYKNLRVCKDASCGHTNELFIIQNKLGYIENNSPKDTKKAKEIALFGNESYKQYIIAKDDFWKSLHAVLIKSEKMDKHPIVSVLENIKQYDDEFAGLDNIFVQQNLKRLYSAKYYMNLLVNPKAFGESYQEIELCEIKPEFLSNELRAKCIKNNNKVK